jgi:hypothetical protein
MTNAELTLAMTVPMIPHAIPPAHKSGLRGMSEPTHEAASSIKEATVYGCDKIVRDH